MKTVSAAASVTCAAAGGAYRLVKGAKSPTGDLGAFPGLFSRIYDLVSAETGELTGEQHHAEPKHHVDTGGTLARLFHREWSGEWRIRLQADTPAGAPPDHAGDRVTHELSARGARSLGESCEYVTRMLGGYTTFLTLTMDAAARDRVARRVAVPDKRPAARAEPRGKGRAGATVGKFFAAGPFTRIEWVKRRGGGPGELVGEEVAAGPWADARGRWNLNANGARREYCGGVQAGGAFCRVRWEWASSIQREVSRFMDAANKVYRRGWVPDYERGRVVTFGDGTQYTPIAWNTERRRLGGPDYGPTEPIVYLWVAENPENEAGERNPHVHMLLRWGVPYGVFPQWAKKIERLWGQGFAHLEKLRAKEAAGYYIAKAAGYLTKAAGESDQGPIRGNRYGIAERARAPGWQPVTVWAWGVMGYLMKEAREKWRAMVAQLRQERDKRAQELKAMDKGARNRGRVAALLTQARAAINELPAFGKFQVVFRSEDSINKFLTWAERNGWTYEQRPPRMWLNEWLRQREIRAERREWIARFAQERYMEGLVGGFNRWEPVIEENEIWAT